MQSETAVIMAVAIFLLHSYLMQNSAAGLPCIINGMANIEVWKEGKPYLAVGDKLWTEQKG
jgi:hypothetical protein